MKFYEIYWDDLTDEAQVRLSDLHHGNIDILPISTVVLEEE